MNEHHLRIVKVLTGHSKILGYTQSYKVVGFPLLLEAFKLYRGWFWTYFGMLVGHLAALLQMLAPHLTRRSSNYLNSPTNLGYSAISSALQSQIMSLLAIVVNVVVVGGRYDVRSAESSCQVD